MNERSRQLTELEQRRLAMMAKMLVIKDFVRMCRVCRCTDDNGCDGGCSWVEENLCSRCVDLDEEDHS